MWMGEIIFTRNGDEIIIETLRSNGTLCTENRISLVDFNKMVDTLLDP